MKLLKINLPKQDTKSIYYVADHNNKSGAISKNPKTDYKLAVNISHTVDGKRVFKRKVRAFTKHESLIRALGIMQGVRADLKEELKKTAPVIAKVGAKTAKKRNYLSDDNPHLTRTLNMAWEDYIKLKEDKQLSETTLRTYRTHYSKHIRDTIGSQLLHTITTEHIQDIINSILEDGKKPRTAQTTQQILRPLFNRELHTEGTLLKTNPVLNTVMPRFNNEKTISITDEQAKNLMHYIYNYEVPLIRSVLVWLTHGRRSSEVRHLKWEHIDFKNDTYLIIAENNKARKPMRYKMTESQKKVLPDVEIKEGYIFHAVKKKNEPISAETLRNHWLKILDRAEIEDFRLHDLRHLIGMELVSAGRSLEQVASVLGHTTIAVTKRYSKVRETVADEALNDFFARVGR